MVHFENCIALVCFAENYGTELDIIIILKIRKPKSVGGQQVGDGEEMCVVGLWSTTHTSGGGGWAATAAAVLFTCRGSLPATPLRSQIIVTLLKSHYVPW